MFKALIKKQFLQMFSTFSFEGKKAEKRKPWMAVLIGALIVYAVGAVVYLFWDLSNSMCEPLVLAGLGWVYFALLTSMGFSISSVLVIFMVKSQVYDAKDNELLFSMPIPSWMILLTRMIGQYLLALLLITMTCIPAMICYFTVVGVTFSAIVGCLLVLLVMPFGTLALGCLIGWLLALITVRLPAKNLVTIIGLFAFMIAYSVGFSKLQDGLNYVLVHGEQIGQTLKVALYPFWQLGLAAMGEWVPMVVFTAIFLGLFALGYLLVSATFIPLATMKRGDLRAKYKEKTAKVRSQFFALFIKESKRFFGNAMIFFNCGLGGVIALVFVGYMLIDGNMRASINAWSGDKQVIAAIITLVACFIATTNVITASSVSLEGESLWVLRSMPVSTTTVFLAKIALHCAVTAIPLWVSMIAVGIIFHLGVFATLMAVLALSAVTLLTALSGLAINLKLPNLKWTSEIVAVKQSLSVLVSMFVGWGIAGLVLGGNFLFGKLFTTAPVMVYLAFAIFAMAAASVVLWLWLKKRGVEIFEGLN